MRDHLALITTPPHSSPDWHVLTPFAQPLSEVFPVLRPTGSGEERRRGIETRRRQTEERRAAKRAARIIPQPQPPRPDPSGATIRALVSRLGSASALALRLNVTPFQVRTWSRGLGVPRGAVRERLGLLARFYGIQTGGET
jgi:hypothetical protein